MHFAKNQRGYGRGVVGRMRGPAHTGQWVRSMIRVIKRMACGACDSAYFFLTIKAAVPGNPYSTTKKPRKSAAFSIQLET